MAANILIGTPQVEFGELLRLNIEESGEYKISVANSGKDVMEKANQIKFNLAILDPTLTDTPFIPLAQNLLDENPDLKLVVVQSQNTTEDQELRDLTIHAFLSRPFYPPDMIEMIQNLLAAAPTSPDKNRPLAEGELQKIAPLPPVEKQDETGSEVVLPEGSSELSANSDAADISNLEEIARALDTANQSENKSGQADIDKLFAQFSGSSPDTPSTDPNNILVEVEPQEIAPLSPVEKQDKTGLEVVLPEGSSELSGNSDAADISNLEEISRALDLAAKSEKKAGQAEIDKLFAQFSASVPDTSPPVVEGAEVETTSAIPENQPPADLKPPIASPPELSEPPNLVNQSPLIIEEHGNYEKLLMSMEISGSDEGAAISSRASPISPKPPRLNDENLFVEDSELVIKHTNLAEKYNILANEYASLAGEHLEMASKHAELAVEKVVKERERLELLKALNPVLEKAKQLLADTSAFAAVIARSGKITSVAGELNPKAIHEIDSTLAENWNEDEKGDLVRFVRLHGNVKEAMIYASVIRDNYILCLIFDNAMPLSRMRSQTTQMARALSSLQLDMVYIPGNETENNQPENDEGSINQTPIPPSDGIDPDEWIPEIPGLQNNEEEAASILQNVFAQLDATIQQDNSPEDETDLSLEEELNRLFIRGAQSTKITPTTYAEENPGPEQSEQLPANLEQSGELPANLEQFGLSDLQEKIRDDEIFQDDTKDPGPASLQMAPEKVNDFENILDKLRVEAIQEYPFEEQEMDLETGEGSSLRSVDLQSNTSISEKVSPPSPEGSLETLVVKWERTATPVSPFVDDDVFQAEDSNTAISFDRSPPLLEPPEFPEKGDEAEIIEDLPQILFEKAYDVAEFNFDTSGEDQPPSEAANVLDRVRAQLDRQAVSASPDHAQDMPDLIPLDEQSEPLFPEPENMNNGSEVSAVDDSASSIDTNDGQNPALIFKEIIDRLEAIPTGTKSVEGEFLYPWENETPAEIADPPTQPVKVLPVDASQTDIPTNPIHTTGPAVDFKSEMKRVGYPESRESTDSSESILMKYNEDINYPHDWHSPPEKILQHPSQRNSSVSELLNNVAYTCILVPRLPEVFITHEISLFLGDLLPQICLIFGWNLVKNGFQPDYMDWTVNVLPAVSPGHLVRVIRQRTSKQIYQQFPSIKEQNFSDDFWAPGYLIINGSEPPDKKVLGDFIQQTRRRQRLIQNLGH
jgi:DNA-binding response OmpR family regulator/REP element-mobilizing transposase RayT